MWLKGKQTRLKQQQDFSVLTQPLPLTLSIPALSFSPGNQSIFTLICLLCSSVPFQYKPFSAHCGICCCVFTQHPKLLGATLSEGLWRRGRRIWKKLYLATHSAINPVMVQLLLSKRWLRLPGRPPQNSQLTHYILFARRVEEKDEKSLIRFSWPELFWVDWSECEQGEKVRQTRTEWKVQLGIEWKPKSSLKSQYKNMQPGLQTYKCYTYFRVQLSRCLRFEGMSVNGSYGEDKAQICSLGLHFFHLDFD